MPVIWREHGLTIFIWTNENNEPIHFHITRGKRGRNCPKFWLLSTGQIVADVHNKYSNAYTHKDILKILELQYDDDFKQLLILRWKALFNVVTFIDKNGV